MAVYQIKAIFIDQLFKHLVRSEVAPAKRAAVKRDIMYNNAFGFDSFNISNGSVDICVLHIIGVTHYMDFAAKLLR